jgi:protein gp37
MGDTSIQWTDRTWNPTRGCSRVSAGCVHCYAERQAVRFSNPGPFQGFVQFANGHPQWTGKVELIESKLEEPLHWRKPKQVFVNSMSDLFHEGLPIIAIKSVFDVMRAAHWHTYQVLTKRAARLLEIVGWLKQQYDDDYPLPNVWLGVSVEDQATADKRIPLLLQTPAAIRFVSYEPALGPVYFTRLQDGDSILNALAGTNTYRDGEVSMHAKLDWIIVGGESGPGARPFDVAWARNTIAQCKAAGVACFYKQGGASNACPHDRKGGHLECFPPDLQVREFPRREPSRPSSQ